MHLEPGLLLLPHNNRWAHKKVTHKIALAGMLLLIAIGPGSPTVAIVTGVLAGTCACLGARVPLSNWVELLMAPVLFAMVGGALVAYPGNGGGDAALSLVARVFGAASATLLLGVTTPLLDVVALFQRRQGFRTLAELFLLSFRAAVAIGEAGLAMGNAIRLRGLGGSWRTAPGIYSAFAGALAIRSLENANRAEAGLAVRGFDGRLPLVGPGASR
jgi:cobalt/nickel transport system permease protein